MVGYLVGWLVGCLAGWLVVLLVGCLVGFMVRVSQGPWLGSGKGSSTWFPIKPGIDLSTVLSSYPKGSDFRHPFKGMPFHVPTETLDGWLVSCLVGWLDGWLFIWLFSWLTGWLVGWLVGWLNIPGFTFHRGGCFFAHISIFTVFGRFFLRIFFTYFV